MGLSKSRYAEIREEFNQRILETENVAQLEKLQEEIQWWIQTVATDTQIPEEVLLNFRLLERRVERLIYTDF